MISTTTVDVGEVGGTGTGVVQADARGGLVMFDTNGLFEFSREVRLRYLADAIKGKVYPVTATDVADSMLRILGHD